MSDEDGGTEVKASAVLVVQDLAPSVPFLLMSPCEERSGVSTYK
jgi:hypothetical protein